MADLTAKDVMNPNVITVREDLSVQELAQFLTEHGISGAPVEDRDGRIIGVVSLTDIAENTSEGTGVEAAQSDFYIRSWEYPVEGEELSGLHIEDAGVPVSEIMTPTVFTVSPDTQISEIARTMVSGRIHRLLVTDSDHLVGIVTTLDLLKVMAKDS